MNWKYKKTTTIDRIKFVEKEMNVSFPQDLIQYILDNNNARPFQAVFDTSDNQGYLMKKNLSFNQEDVENIYGYIDWAKSKKGVIPFANDCAGNIICLKDNKVWLFSHETETFEFIANTIDEFINKLYSL